jgi:hypothetical protein
MNPFLEQDGVWLDFHKGFCALAAELLTKQVRPKYIVRIERHRFVHERQSCVGIRERSSGQLITVLELLVQANKSPSPSHYQYLVERHQICKRTKCLVEIDLLRGGRRPIQNNLPACDYYASVSRVETHPRIEFWPIHLRDRLPTIPIPLRSADPYARLDLQAVVDRIYDAAGYEDYIYDGQTQPRLAADDEAWARQFLPSAP